MQLDASILSLESALLEQEKRIWQWQWPYQLFQKDWLAGLF